MASHEAVIGLSFQVAARAFDGFDGMKPRNREEHLVNWGPIPEGSFTFGRTATSM